MSNCKEAACTETVRTQTDSCVGHLISWYRERGIADYHIARWFQTDEAGVEALAAKVVADGA